MEGQRSLVLALMSTRELLSAYASLRARLFTAWDTGTAYEVAKWREDLEELAEELADRGVDPHAPFDQDR